LGYENTLPVTIDEMLHHTKAVTRAKPDALVVTDMPFLSYNLKDKETLRAAGRLIKEGGAQAVKLEGGREVKDSVRLLIDNSIPVMGHLGLTPQSVHKMGGYKVQGKDDAAAKKIFEDAVILEESGVFAIVLEGMPSALAKKITDKLSVPTIGIGAGVHCDGQILVVNDMLGLSSEFTPKFVRKYAELGKEIEKAFNSYSADVKEGKFPSEKESY